MGKEGQNKEYFAIEERSYEFAAKVQPQGNSFYIRLPPELLRFYDLKKGDLLDLRLIQVRRKFRIEDSGRYKLQ